MFITTTLSSRPQPRDLRLLFGLVHREHPDSHFASYGYHERQNRPACSSPPHCHPDRSRGICGCSSGSVIRSILTCAASYKTQDRLTDPSWDPAIVGNAPGCQSSSKSSDPPNNKYTWVEGPPKKRRTNPNRATDSAVANRTMWPESHRLRAVTSRVAGSDGIGAPLSIC